LKNKSIFN